MTTIEELYKACDTHGRGYLEQDELRELCSRFGIARHDADALFEDLDCDRDGRISFEDFSKGFSDFATLSTSSARKDVLIDDYHASREKFKEVDTPKTAKPFSTSKESIHASTEVPIIEELLEDMRKLQEENRRLENNWKREKREHELHLHRLEEEIDSQVKEVEFRATAKAKEAAEAEKKTLKVQMDAEINQMQSNLMLFEKMDSWLKSNKTMQQDEKYQDVRQRLDDSALENRHLKMSLLDTQTNVALMRTELAQLRTQYDEKCRELSSERERVLEALHEQEHMARQVNLMHDANRRLQDTNDTMRVVLETTAAGSPKPPYVPRCQRGSIIGNYIGDDVPGNINKLIEINKRAEKNQDLREENGDYWEEEKSGVESYRPKAEDLEMANFRMQRFVKDLATRNSIHSDSGMSTMKDVELEDGDAMFDDPDKKHNSLQSTASIEEEVEKRRTPDIAVKQTTTGSLCSLDLPSRQRDLLSDSTRRYGSLPRSIAHSEGTPRMRRRGEVAPCVSYEPTGTPERTYKVIFIGDAAVGKSSFIMRLSKGVFVQNLSSTLGVDFQMKSLLVDQKNVALQLWDTAGQERFRSMTQSYFRKADGIMILFDVSSERSFLNVRDWMQSVEDGTSTPYRIPVLLVANKVDLREVAMLKGENCITREDGEKLAKSYDILYIETSAKHGDNVVEAVAKLTRLMHLNEDREIKASGMRLMDGKKKKKCC